MNVACYTQKVLETIMQEYSPEDEKAQETAFRVIAVHPDASGTIACVNCGWADHVRCERKEMLKAHTLKCKNCGAVFTKFLKEENNNGRNKDTH